MLAADDASGFELKPSLLRPVGFARLGMHGPDLYQQGLVARSAHTQRALAPLVVATARDLEHRAHALEPELLLMAAHERVPHRRSLAKYAAAFLRMSRSSVTR